MIAKKTTSKSSKNQHPELEGAKFDPTPLLKQVSDLQAELTEKEEITKRSQIDYLNLKTDFEFLQRHTEQKLKNAEKDALITVIKKIIPTIENLRKSLLNLSEEQLASPTGQGVQMVYKLLIQNLADFHIFPIEAIGLEPDSNLHEPVATQPVIEKKQKGKIIDEFEQGFYYQKEDEKILIHPSKVVVGV